MKFKQLLVLIVFVALAGSAIAQKTILITNVHIFNGRDNKIIPGNVLITGNQITRISDKPIPVNKSANTSIIDGKESF